MLSVFPSHFFHLSSVKQKNVHNLVLPKTKISVAVKSLDIYFFFCIPFAMLKGQVGCHGKVGNQWKGLHPTKQLLPQVCWLWPGLTSLLHKGGAQLTDMLRSLDASAAQALHLCRRFLSCRGGLRADSDRLSHGFPTYPTACCLCLCGCSSPAQQAPLRGVGGGNQEGRVPERWGESPHP